MLETGTPVPTEQEFTLFQKLILDRLGIFLPIQKKALLSNRLWKRLLACNFSEYRDYYNYIVSEHGRSELALAMELVTTNETYFFREQKHFDFLSELCLNQTYGSSFRIWSAASSTGEEPYSIAMLLDDQCKAKWELLCSDVNCRVLDQARTGIYPEGRCRNIPEEYLQRYCRKGIGPYEGSIRVSSILRERVEFFSLNLNESFPDIGKFDLVFLRNVLIYFENDTKTKVLERIAKVMNPNGYLFVGHSESLHGLTDKFVAVKPAIYRVVTKGLGNAY